MGASRDSKILIYGAYGDVGRDIARRIADEGDGVGRHVLAGRRAAPLDALAAQHGLEARAFSLDEPDAIAAQLADVDAVLLLAGPYEATAAPVLDACLRTGTSYLDISGEKSVSRVFFETRRAEIEAAGIVAMPSVGFDTVLFDCLAATLADRHGEPDTIELAFAVTTSAKPSTGTVKTMMNMARAGEFSLARVGGQLVRPPADRRRIEVTLPLAGPTSMRFSSLTDVYTAYFSTGVPNFYTYVPPDMARATGMMTQITKIPGATRGLSWVADRLMPAPSEENTVPMTAEIWGRASGAARECVACATVDDMKGYTALAALRASERVASRSSDLRPGTYTPSMAFGVGFAFEVPGATLLAPPSA